ncbi:hypothetical protein B0T11DRAFT_306393 [Plectosphaerella cucumerina]|uniref:Growth hormone-inducible transmembrane protein n=1 Tax=Plectosphaerella cucumerina TaxID=40658 RepID=A0A8K0TGE2_9PEZI|nr:hypothetical protein B0T11DRAFT_306393 [Plectosphaerella cucumerina]
MRRSRSGSSPSPYRALAHQQNGGAVGHQIPDSISLIRSFNVEATPTRPVRPSPLTASTIRDMPLDLVDRIRSFPLFQSASEDFLAAIGNHLRPQIHAAQDHILHEGDDAKAMYWVVRGVVAVTSRDGEAVYAELKAGSFFGEIGVLMDVPRTASIVARTKCLLVVLKKEDLQTELPNFPEMEQAIRQEAEERLNLLKKKRMEGTNAARSPPAMTNGAREPAPGEVSTGEVGTIREGAVLNHKKRKSPSPGAIEDPAAGSALGSGFVNVRKTLKELPLFSALPPDILHFLGLSALPKTFSPFTDIIRQGTPGNDIFFIVRGEAEVIHEGPVADEPFRNGIFRGSYVRPRLKAGQYFGEVASLGLSAGRTATVRSITTVECLMIGGDALDELWRKCPPNIKSQVEETARLRYQKPDDDIEMGDVTVEPRSKSDPPTPTTPKTLPHVTFTTPSKPASPIKDVRVENMAPKDPDPFLSVDMENMRNRRRNSLAPPTPQSDASSPIPVASRSGPHAPLEASPIRFSMLQSPPDEEAPSKRARTLPHRPLSLHVPALPDKVLVNMFRFFNVGELMRLRLVSPHWRMILENDSDVCLEADLSDFSRRVNDRTIKSSIAPFLGTRPHTIDISSCFHITDDGFRSLWEMCGKNVKRWRMRSVWDVSANQILDMSENAKGLEEVDWSNCRKVGDNLLARVVGWVVPEPPPPMPQNKHVVISSSSARGRPAKQPPKPVNMPKPGTVIGCPKLQILNLSYCKHITDRSMAHLAAHASPRLRSLSLTRCTSITDAGFQSWAPFRFSNLTHLCLADCTYLSDNAIVALVGAAKNLTHLDLSFCCALSDTSTEVVALGLPQLRELRLAFCGSAVSDASLQSVALHLNDLQGISVRGCVRVTGGGVENLLEGCSRLNWVDVSQCRNLEPWLRTGGVSRWGFDDRGDIGSYSSSTLPVLVVEVITPRLSAVNAIPALAKPPPRPLGRPARLAQRLPELTKSAAFRTTASRAFHQASKPSTTGKMSPAFFTARVTTTATTGLASSVSLRAAFRRGYQQQTAAVEGGNLRKLLVGGAIFGGTLVAINAVFNRETRDDGGMPIFEREYLNSTFLHTGLGIGIIGLTARQMIQTGFVYRLMVTNPWVIGIGGLALSFGTMIATRSISPDNYIPKYAMWTAFNATQAALVAPMLAFVPVPLLARAGLYTLAMMGALSVVGATAKQEKYLYIGGPLLAGAAIVAVSGLAPLVIPATAIRTLAFTESIWLYGGLAVFGGFTLYDVQKVLYHARLAQQGIIKKDPVNESISLELDFLNIFIRMVQILMMQNRKK